MSVGGVAPRPPWWFDQAAGRQVPEGDPPVIGAQGPKLGYRSTVDRYHHPFAGPGPPHHGCHLIPQLSDPDGGKGHWFGSGGWDRSIIHVAQVYTV